MGKLSSLTKENYIEILVSDSNVLFSYCFMFHKEWSTHCNSIPCVQFCSTLGNSDAGNQWLLTIRKFFRFFFKIQSMCTVKWLSFSYFCFFSHFKIFCLNIFSVSANSKFNDVENGNFSFIFYFSFGERKNDLDMILSGIFNNFQISVCFNYSFFSLTV